MQSIFESMLDKLWKKWVSFPILVIIILLALANSIPTEWGLSDAEALKFYILSIVSLFALVFYFIICYKENSLPKAKRLSVLFVIDTESTGLFQEVKNKLVTNFADCFDNSDEYAFSALCLSVDKVSKYDLHKNDSLLSLLRKTNCVFFVRVRYHVDSISNAERFEMAVNYGIVHPSFQENATKLLTTEMNFLAAPIKKRSFKKPDSIDNLDFTAQALSTISQYLLSIVYLLSGNIEKSYTILSNLYEKKEKGDEIANRYNIDLLIKIRLFEACVTMINKYFDQFYYKKSDEVLIKLNEKLEEANRLFPDTYDYFLGKAYYHVAFALDGNTARNYINKCKEFKSIKTWKYSEAFLTAFSHKSPNTIIKKYEDAFKVPYDLLRIADYVEYIIEKSPEHVDLHLAVALVYDKIGDTALASEHFKVYLQTEAGKKITDYIKKMLLSYTQNNSEI